MPWYLLILVLALITGTSGQFFHFENGIQHKTTCGQDSENTWSAEGSVNLTPGNAFFQPKVTIYSLQELCSVDLTACPSEAPLTSRHTCYCKTKQDDTHYIHVGSEMKTSHPGMTLQAVLPGHGLFQNMFLAAHIGKLPTMSEMTSRVNASYSIDDKKPRDLSDEQTVSVCPDTWFYLEVCVHNRRAGAELKLSVGTKTSTTTGSHCVAITHQLTSVKDRKITFEYREVDGCKQLNYIYLKKGGKDCPGAKLKPASSLVSKATTNTTAATHARPHQYGIRIDYDSIPDYKTYPELDVVKVDDIRVDTARNAMYFKGKLWPNGIVPFVIDSNYPDVAKEKIKAAIEEIEYNVNTPGKEDCIDFVPRTSQVDYLNILPRGHSCDSAVGRSRGAQDVSIGRGCEYKGTIMHELVHALGFWHEVGRPDRESYVDINRKNIKAGHGNNFKIYRFAKTLNTSYDYDSIMQYSAYAFGIDRRIPTIIPLTAVPDGAQMGQRHHLTKTDVLKIQRLYGCKEDTTHVRRPVIPPGGYCDFVHGFCGFTQDPSNGFDWIIQNTTMPNGAHAGDTTGNDNYVIATASGHKNKRARLVSLAFTQRKLCVDFSYFNHDPYGAGAMLRVILLPTEESKKSLKYVTATYASTANEWVNVVKSISVSSEIPTYQLVFEAHIMSTYIAIDNLKIYEGECQ